jgi:flagella basal body P-ring formation protein FlgA
MTLRSFLTRALCVQALVLFALPSFADSTDLQALRLAVEQHLQAHYHTRFGESSDQHEMVIEVGKLDPRLRLGECEQSLTMHVKEPPQAQGNVTVKTACESGQRWTIYVPARVDIFAPVAVAARSLPRGHLIDEADISYQRSNVSQLGFGHIADGERLLGMEVQRAMKAGDAFRLSSLEQPDVVKRGDSVVVEAQAGSLTVVAPGKALANGQIGQQIRVENTQSRRVIDARVIAPGRVKVLL